MAQWCIEKMTYGACLNQNFFKKVLNRRYVLVMAILSLTMNILHGQGENVMSDPVAKPLKIGVVNTTLLLQKAPGVLRAKALLEKEFMLRDREIIVKQGKFRELRETLAQNEALPEAEKRLIEREALLLDRDIQRMQDEFQQDYSLRRNEELLQAQKQINEAILQYAKANGYDLILESGVLYYKEDIELTSRILEHLE